MIPKALLTLALAAGLVSCSTIPQIPFKSKLEDFLDPDSEAPCFMAKFGRGSLRFDPCFYPDQSQCGITELRWEKTVGPYTLSIIIDPTTHPHPGPPRGTRKVITNLTETSYPILVRGPADGGLYVNLTDAIGGQARLAMLIGPSSDSSCLA
ncbi:hypothetical protein V8D89_000452 [Ganoderma adspersum]